MLKKIQSVVLAMGIAFFCFGYFASYIPYSMMTKMVTKGLIAGQNGHGFNGFEIQPIIVFGTFAAMYLFLTLSGWWKYATHTKIFGVSVPRPRWITFISGLCTSGVIITTTLAYTFKGVSIVFAMLLMRGGVLMMAPIVDFIAIKRKRKIYWPSWTAAILSLAALLLSFSSNSSLAMTTVATIDIVLYLACYFFRFFFMSNWAKSTDLAEKKRFFTEEQMVANPALLLGVLIVGWVGSSMSPNSTPGQIWHGMTVLPSSGFFWTLFLIGVFSYGTGLFGNLIFLDHRENTFTVPANRVSSVLSGVVATYLLYIFYGQHAPEMQELIGVGLIIFSIIFLTYHTVVEKKRKVHYEPKALEKEAEKAHLHNVAVGTAQPGEIS